MPGTNLEVPDEFDEWPYDARSFVLAEANTVIDLRKEVDALAGISSEELKNDSAGQFTKEEMATLVMALGGPSGGGSVMLPIWAMLIAAASRRSRSSEATDDDVADAIQEAEPDRSDDSDGVDQINDRGVACIGEPGRAVFCPAESVTIRKFHNTSVADVEGTEWIKTNATVHVEEVR